MLSPLASTAILFGRTGHAAALYILLAGLQRGTPLFILPFISQVMSPAEYGAATMLTVTSLLLVTIIAAPLESFVFRVSARGGDDAPALLRATGMYCYWFTPLICAVFAGCVAMFVPSFLEVTGHVWAVELLAVGFQPAMAYFALPMVQARQNLVTFAFLASTSILLMASSKLILLLVLQLGVLGWAISDLFTAAMSAMLAFALVRLPHGRTNIGHLRAVAGFAVPLIPHKASLWAIASLSRPALALVSSLTQVGLLSLGWNVATIANLILSEINRATLPRYSRETFPAPTHETRTAVRVQVVLSLTVPAAVGAALTLVGGWIFPPPYWPAFALTGIILVGQAAYGLYLIPTNYVVQAAGTTKPVALASGAGAGLILACLLAFGHTYGATGAAYAITGGIVTMLLISTSITRFLKLRISWRSWARCWPEAALGFVALTCSVTALMFPVGSSTGRLIAAAFFLPAGAALIISIRRVHH